MLKSVIVLTNSIDESEKIKSLASFNESTFDLRYMSALELAEYLLQLSGITYKQTFVRNDLLGAMIYKQIKEIPYFSLFTYNDISLLLSTLEDVRYRIVDNEYDEFLNRLPTDKFVTKNEAIKKAYKLITNYLKDNNYIDEVGVVRFALENAKPQPNIEFVRYEKSHLRPLELALLNKAAGKEVSESSVGDSSKNTFIETYTKAFGQSNEIEDIIHHIYREGLKFDECLIASAEETNYANVLNNYKDLLKAPIILGVGKSVLSTNPGKLYSLINDWEKNHHHKDFLLKIVNSEYFDAEKFKRDLTLPEDLSDLNAGLDWHHKISLESITETIGDLKITFDNSQENMNKYLAYHDVIQKYVREKYDEKENNSRYASLRFVQYFIEIINKGLINFLKEYSLKIDEKVDGNALDKIVTALTYEKDYGISPEDVKKMIFSQKVGREKPQPGNLYFTSISRAASCLRKHLFIVGLSSNNFPGKNIENPIILDRDYEQFGLPQASAQGIETNRDAYFSLIDEAMKYGVKVYLSWSCYNEETLKGQNPSSVVFGTYQSEHEEQKTLDDFEKEFKTNKEKFRYIEYFENELLPIKNIGKAVADNKDIKFENVPSKEEIKEISMEIFKSKSGFSASAIGNYAKCPYMFFLQNILGIQSDKEIDPTEIIPANDYGTLAHGLLETLDKKKISKDEFLNRASQRFDEYLIIHPTDNLSLAKLAKDDFIKTMDNAYEMETSAEVVSAEEDFSYTHETGIRIHGFPDKVISFKPGHYYVVDYKTGRKVKHDVDSPADMSQCTIYSYLFSKYKKGAIIDGFEYRYIRTKDVVTSADSGQNMDYHYAKLTEILTEFKQSLETGVFLPNQKHCHDCFIKEKCRNRKK